MVIYLIRNKLNDKGYVGQTRQALAARWSRHRWASTLTSGRMPISSALHKHGVENFEISVLETCTTQDELDERERYWAKHLSTFVPHGYNLKAGAGRGSCSKEVRDKIAAAHRGKHVSAETRRRLSEAHRGQRLSEGNEQDVLGNHRQASAPSWLDSHNGEPMNLDKKHILSLVRLAKQSLPARGMTVTDDKFTALVAALYNAPVNAEVRKFIDFHPGLDEKAVKACETLVSALTQFAEIRKSLDQIDFQLDPQHTSPQSKQQYFQGGSDRDGDDCEKSA